jgi:hypothetical protein
VSPIVDAPTHRTFARLVTQGVTGWTSLFVPLLPAAMT